MKRLLALLLCGALTWPAWPAGDSLMTVMQQELTRCMQELKQKSPSGPYFMSYDVTDSQSVEVDARGGSLLADKDEHTRTLDVDVRVGSMQLDNTHAASAVNLFSAGQSFPLEDDPVALANAFYVPTETAWRLATRQYAAISASQQVGAQDTEPSADFSQEAPQQYRGPQVKLDVDRDGLRQSVREASARLTKAPFIHLSAVAISVDAINQAFVNSEGTRLQFGTLSGRLEVEAVAQTDDGMLVDRTISVERRDPHALPKGAELDAIIDHVADDVKALRAAPTMDPYTGPAILSGRAAAVFFHEVFGHRIEGHRQKGDQSGQTFTRRIGEPVLPAFMSVVDDPTRTQYNNIDLNGTYQYDDEGVKAEPVVVVDHGILKNFLMSRIPVPGFDHSNGHGRKSAGHRAVGRQGNLIVESSQSESDTDLRKHLIELCKQQGKPYGILLDDVVGGFTLTARDMPQAFEVRPSMVYKVYVDGRPDELVRGVALIGTPLTTFSRIVACGDHDEVFNGTCGAESGWVPVSAVAPPLLIEQIEIQKQGRADQRPPILPPP